MVPLQASVTLDYCVILVAWPLASWATVDVQVPGIHSLVDVEGVIVKSHTLCLLAHRFQS